ncbi:hypothetical protein [Thalassospira sp.]|uniref:hypothetical protein n=1 Tax=Thalassospira sp. TaxID=1912094 RepID=UPI000C37AE4D|nr:hypothetical protein [Thalassospira sp.]MBC05848.1 hypothetical protein [Thalassospira sp.]|tara:strand:- start:14969 stop:15760 length:792 start_codon:yes stop_codon:yes gene_type:complete
MSKELEDQDYVLLSAYIDGELVPTECRELEDRIAKCPVMTRQFNIMAGQSVVLRNQAERLLADRVYPELAQDIEDILDQKKPASRHFVEKSEIEARGQSQSAANNNKPIWTGIGAAAAVLLAFVGGNWFNETSRDAGVADIAANTAPSAFYSPVNNPVLDEEISMTLEKTLSGDIRHVSLGTSPNTDGAVEIEPLRTFRQGGLFCREYHVTFPADRTESGPDGFFGRACRTEDGKWETVYRLIPGIELPALDGENDTTPKQKL